MKTSADVVICGAGSIGVAVAYYLVTNHQICDVLLVDKHPPLSQTSAKSGENVRAWWPVQPMIDLANRSFHLMEGLVAESGNAFHMEKRGYAYATQDKVGLRAYLDHYRSLTGLGKIRIHGEDAPTLPYTPPSASRPGDDLDGADVLLAPDLIRRTFPHFAAAIQAVVHTRRAGSISAQQLGMLLLEQAQSAGAQLLRGEVVDVETAGGAVRAVQVRTAAGVQRVETRAFVNAAGPFANRVAAMLGQSLPVQTVFQQKIAFQDRLGVIPRDAPFTIFMDQQRIDWSPEERRELASDLAYAWLLDELPGGLHVKAEGGADSTWIKLGWALNQESEEPLEERQGAPEFPEVVLRGATRLAPGLRQYIGKLPRPLLHYGGYYTKTRENLPLIGPMDVHGAYVAGAFSGFGTMMSCAAGELAAAWVAEATLPGYAEIFSLGRYEDPAQLEALAQMARRGEL
jgi:glycine/D-amino acid oxidase-like deaminating enzyme